MDDRERKTQVVIGALENLQRSVRDAPEHAGVADDTAELLADLRSGEMTLAHCGDDECSHGWHYTEHSDVRGILVDLGGRSALALLLSVMVVCATVLLVAEMLLVTGTPVVGAS